MIFFQPTEIKSDRCTARFTALDGATDVGTCDLWIHDNTADLTALSVQDADIGEGLFRAALNYAANKGIYMAVCTAPDADEVIARMKFERENGVFQNDIPTLLMGHCGC